MYQKITVTQYLAYSKEGERLLLGARDTMEEMKEYLEYLEKEFKVNRDDVIILKNKVDLEDNTLPTDENLEKIKKSFLNDKITEEMENLEKSISDRYLMNLLNNTK